ncbi:MAG TPA: pyridoxal-phosphate dependent enzyme, partial [Alphaproteobacteria bacterium]|nr:pyridoxal-phosphate dependent enzyme [Alphaproteobacteria bacterium]
ECLQVTGSFKARGAVSKLKSLGAAEIARGLVTASGGNHGLGVAYAGWLARVPARVYLPTTAPKAKAEKLKRWGAEAVFAGGDWYESNKVALAAAEREGLTYIHPFADPAVIAGQGTISLEILEDDPRVDSVLVAIGGGGLIAGVATALKALQPRVKVIGVEPTGAAALFESLKAGRIVELEEIKTEAGSLAARRTEPLTFAHVRQNVDDIVLVSDDEMRAAAEWLWFELGLSVELSAAAAIAALRTGRYKPHEKERLCVIVCGAGTDGLG